MSASRSSPSIPAAWSEPEPSALERLRHQRLDVADAPELGALSRRTSNLLRRVGVTDLAALRAMSRSELEAIPNAGRGTLAEIEGLLGTRAADLPRPPRPRSRDDLRRLALRQATVLALQRAGMTEVDPLLRMSRRELAQTRGIGEGHATEIAIAAAQRGRLLPSDSPEGPTPLAALQLAPRYLGAVIAAGAGSAEQLVERPLDELRAIGGLGKGGTTAVRIALARAGLRPLVADDLSSVRDVALVRARLEGQELEAIATTHGLSRQRVDQLLKRYCIGPAEARAARERANKAALTTLVPEIRRQFRDGRSSDDIARELGVHRTQILTVIRHEMGAADRAARNALRSAARAGGTPDDVLHAAVRRLAAELGRAPTAPEYAARAKELGLPGPQTLAGRHGSWRQAVAATGLEPSRAPRRDYQRVWDAERCESAARTLARELGRWPTAPEYERLKRARSSQIPSLATLTRRCGLRFSEIGSAMEQMLEEERGADGPAPSSGGTAGG